jgi:uncharacterized protein YndB with AHSA1/START domain
MTTLRVDAEGTAAAAAETVWSLLADASRYAEWGPWDGSGDRDLGGKQSGDVGTVRWLRWGNTTTVERVTEVEPGKRMVYTVVKGIPVRNYRAEVRVAPIGLGTHIYWAAEWDRTLLGRIVARKLRSIYPQIMASLIAGAEHETALACPPKPIRVGYASSSAVSFSCS